MGDRMHEARQGAVEVKCMECGRRKWIYAFNIPKGEHPCCDKDGSPMIPVKAQIEGDGR